MAEVVKFFGGNYLECVLFAVLLLVMILSIITKRNNTAPTIPTIRSSSTKKFTSVRINRQVAPIKGNLFFIFISILEPPLCILQRKNT
ncbi:MAG: hypothetical protein K0Q87_3512 [Neobacillus sp.]|nr:hypothetical protein [Neobacillus sp.]